MPPGGGMGAWAACTSRHVYSVPQNSFPLPAGTLLIKRNNQRRGTPGSPFCLLLAHRVEPYPVSLAVEKQGVARPFLKSNSRLRMPGRAGSTISSARFCVRHSPSFGTPSAGLRNSLKDRKRRGLSAQTSSPSRLRRTAPSVPRGYPSDSRNATLPEKVPPAGQSVLCFEKGSNRTYRRSKSLCTFFMN